MLKKLRRQFIAITMLSVIVVLAIIIGSINAANFITTSQSLDFRLKLISANGGSFPQLTEEQLNSLDNFQGSVDQEDSTESSTEYSTEEAEGQGRSLPPALPQIQPDDTEMEEPNAAGENMDKPAEPADHPEDEAVIPDNVRGNFAMWGISAETQYNTRYFSVTVSEDGTVTGADTGKIAAISDDEAQEYAMELYTKGKLSGYGFKGNYRYMVSQVTDSDGNESLLYVFMECSTDVAYVKMFLIASVGISLVGLLIVFILVFFLSARVVKPMAESYEKQKRFITDASHEIKTPLTIIDANTEILEMMEGENEWTASIRKQIRRLTSLTEKLVFLSRMDEENTKLEMIDFAISDAISDVAEGFEAVADIKGKTLDVNIEPNLSYCGDEKNIRQLVSLLLDNAMKYSDEHGTIRLDFGAGSKGKILKVWNTVEEIEPGNLDRLFDRFYRVDSSHNSKTGGFGIGLSVAKAIVSAHKGKITARSDDGKSIEFQIMLP